MDMGAGGCEVDMETRGCGEGVRWTRGQEGVKVNKEWTCGQEGVIEL